MSLSTIWRRWCQRRRTFHRVLKTAAFPTVRAASCFVFFVCPEHPCMVLIELTNCCVTQQPHSELQLLRCCVYSRIIGINSSFPLPISTITPFYCSLFKLMNTNFYIHVWCNIISNLLHESVYCIAISLMRNSQGQTFLVMWPFLTNLWTWGPPYFQAINLLFRHFISECNYQSERGCHRFVEDILLDSSPSSSSLSYQMLMLHSWITPTRSLFAL